MNVNFFVTPNDSTSLLWSGPRAGIDGSKELFGIQNSFDIKELDDAIEEICKLKDHSFYIDYDPEHSSLKPEVYKKIKLMNVVKPIEPVIRPLRLVKTREEQELMKRSALIASESFRQVNLR